MGNLPAVSERARRLTGHPLYKNERQALILIAKTWPRLAGIEFNQADSETIYLAIMDARSADRDALVRQIRQGPIRLRRHVDAVGTTQCKASPETLENAHGRG